MPVFVLNENLLFPNPNLADDHGLLAVGGDLSIQRLLLAYSNGIFPWYSEGDPIMWWSPNPRMVLFPDNFKVSKSMRQTIRNKKYKVLFDTNFKQVIENCAKLPREDQGGTWITKEMQEAYLDLHREGYAHSIETYLEGKLVGGLYGISLGKAFFGESMFFKQRDASKVALYYLVEKFKKWNFLFIDAQTETEHLKSLGAVNIHRSKFLQLLKIALKSHTIKGKW
ncbi:MAG: leucyl/phenylalanyl-tRNA--protein transferase [Bacteroidales bacterium]|nr:leucyl/phenylalanyl-tRNA--protein transferase [Bacteroidales bacterium]